jgi:TRAP-type mannitol/chloroaromatic compound transport system substrate-binding protein
MPPFECFDATSKGTIEAYMGAASYWTGKDPAAEWFISIPFGMDPQGMAVWCYQGDGLKLWEETYAPFNVLPRLGPGFAPQMGGWFKRKITTIADYTGLKMRIAGLGSKLKGKVELVQFPAPVLRDLRKLTAAVIREQSEKSPMARKVHASFVKFQALLGGWEHVAEGAYHQLLKG